MNQTTNTSKICPACQTSCPADATFCFACGTKLPTAAFCAKCGARRMGNAVFCHACGTKYDDISASPAPSAAPAPAAASKTIYKAPQLAPKKARKHTVSEWIRSFVLLFVALTLAVFAFCPIAKITYSASTADMLADIRISPVENIVYFFDALKSEDEDDLEDSDLYDEHDDILDDILEHDDDDIPEDLIEDFIKTAIRLGLQHEDLHATTALTLSALLSLIYLLLCIALAVMAILNLVFFLVGKKGGVSLFRASVLLLALIPALIPVLLFATTASVSSAVTVLGYGFGLSFGGVVGLIVSILAILFVIISSYIFNKRSVRLAALLLRVFCVLLIAAAMISVYLPVMELNLDVIPMNKTEEREAIMKFPLAVFSSFSLGEEEFEQYEDFKDFETADYIQVCRDAFSVYKIVQIESGEADALGQQILEALSFGCGEDEIAPWFTQYVTLATLTLVLLALLLWQALYALCFDRARAWITVPCRILAPLFAFALLALCGLFVFMINENIAQLDLKRDMICNISIAPILLAAFSLVACCLPFLAGKKEETEATSVAVIGNATGAETEFEAQNEGTPAQAESALPDGQEETSAPDKKDEEP